MNHQYTVIVLVAALAIPGCSTNRTIRLTDGRVFSPTMVATESDRLQFKANGWEYNLPSYMLATGGLASATVKIQKVEVAKDSIVTADGNLVSFHELMAFVDRTATRTCPVIVVLPDAPSWSESRRQEFGKAYGEVHQRPNVGLEVLWPKKWLPEEPGRELSKQ